MKKSKKYNSNDYFEKIQEWQEHQYDPGYYTGGKIPHYLTHPGHPKLLGWLLVISSIIYGIILLFMIISGFDEEQLLPIVIFAVLVGCIIAIQIFAGIRMIKKSHVNESKKVSKSILKFLIIIGTGILIVSVSFSLIYKFNEQLSEINIYSRDQFICNQFFSNQYNKSYYIQLRERDIRISCTKEEYDILDNISRTNKRDKVIYRVSYKWNSFNGKEGKIVKLSKESD